MKDFGNKTVFITGGSSGIGLATANKLAAKGANIIIFARREVQLDESVQEIKTHTVLQNQTIDRMTIDVADNENITSTLEAAVKKFGVPDLFINCAGGSFAARFDDITSDQFDNLIRINLNGTRNATAAILPHMKRKGRGIIVIVASTAGLIPVYGYTAYGTSKYALVGLAECLRPELKPQNIRVHVLCPPEVDTPLVENEEKTSPAETKLLKHLAGKLTADEAADALIKGIEKNRFMIIPGKMAKLLYFTQRMTPGFLFRFSTDLLVWLGGKRN